MKYRTEIINIQTGERIPSDEPLFIIRAQDTYSGAAVDAYAQLLEDDGNVPPEQIQAIRDHANLMEAWPTKKVPD